MADHPDPFVIQGESLQRRAEETQINDILFRIGRSRTGEIVCESADVSKPQAFERVLPEMVPTTVMSLLRR